MKKEVFRYAHNMTKAMVKQYPEIDYQTQFGINLSYAYSIVTKNSQIDLAIDYGVEITGVSQKQIDYAKSLVRQAKIGSRVKYESVMSTVDFKNAEKLAKENNLSVHQLLVKVLVDMNLAGYYVEEFVSDAKEIIELLKY